MTSEKIWKIQKKSKLNCGKIWKIQKKSKLNCGKIWKIQKKSKLNNEKIGKIRKKPKLNSEKIWKIQRTWSTTQHIRKHTGKRAGNPNFQLRMGTPFHPFGVT